MRLITSKNMKSKSGPMTHLVTNLSSEQPQTPFSSALMHEDKLKLRWMKYLIQNFSLALGLMLLVVALAYVPASLSAVPNIVIPSARGSSNSDEINTANGTRCRQAVGSDTMIDLGVVADETGSAGVYGRITIPIGAPKRIDCSRLYDMELQRLQAELDELRGLGGGGRNSYLVE